MKKTLIVSMALFIMAMNAMAQESFCIAKNGKIAAIVVDEQDWKGVIRAANDLGDDVRKVCGTPSEVIAQTSSSLPHTSSIVVGTIGKNRLIDRLIKQKKLDVKRIKGKWEGYVIDWVDGNLVIAGNNSHLGQLPSTTLRTS